MKNIQFFLLFVIATTCLFAQKGKNDWLVEVKLKNGTSFKGVARNAVFLEKQNYGGYVVLKNQNRKIVRDLSNKKERAIRSSMRNLGIRLWYVKNSPGYLYIPYGDVNKIVVIEKSYNARAKVVKKINEVAKDYRERQKERGEREEKKIVKQQKRIEEKQKVLEEPKLVLTKDEKEILEQFPPGSEWNEANRNRWHKRLNRARNNFSRTTGGTIAKNRFGGVTRPQRDFHKNFDFWKTTVAKDKKIKEQEEKEKLAQEQAEKEQNEQKKDTVQKDKNEALAKEDVSPPSSEKEVKEEKKEDPKESYSSVEEINHLLYGKNPQLQMRAIERLGEMKEKSAITALISIVENSDIREQRLAAMSSLGKIYTEEQEILLLFKKYLRSKSLEIRTVVMNSLFNTEEDLSPIKEIINFATLDSNKDIRYRAISIIEKQEFVESVKIVTDRLRDRDPKVKIVAIYTLTTLDKSEKMKKYLSRYRKFLKNKLKETDNSELIMWIEKTLERLK
ncbi:HEAT repeat domain-containing protein [Candidatus Uabimicrobium sp. HlEnr_7]|uniref:HEAT repeat domain-containing protein n=1 Tax=Candidatus Uabimicrobium helgolandensis TaxID=3095367 RepID=UPI00355616AC